jgi:hypothetical protein
VCHGGERDRETSGSGCEREFQNELRVSRAT